MPNRKTPQAAEVSRLLSLNLGTFRQRAGLSQQGTAERAGLNRTHIALIEGGQPQPISISRKPLETVPHVSQRASGSGS